MFMKTYNNPLKIFRIRKITRTIHSGIGFYEGDNVDILDRIIEFGYHPFTWLEIRLWTKVTTKQNIYIFNGLTGKYTWISL